MTGEEKGEERVMWEGGGREEGRKDMNGKCYRFVGLRSI